MVASSSAIRSIGCGNGREDREARDGSRRRGQRLRVDSGVGECERGSVCSDCAWDKCVAAQTHQSDNAAREDEERETDEEGEKGGETDGAEEGGCAVVEGCGEDLARRWCWNGQPVEIPLADCCCGGGTLDACAYGKSPEVNEHEEDA